jgi:glycosyltransferase involved in cell wall biosynthesis
MSALGQHDVDVDVVVVDDGSTDGTADLLRNMEEPRLRVVHHPVSRGVSAARNAGIEVADCPWVAFLDDDDLWAPHKLTRQLDAASKAEAGFVYSSAAVLDESFRVTRIDRAPRPEQVSSLLLAFNAVPGGGSGVLVATELVRDVGGFDETLAEGEDWEMWVRLTNRCRAAACQEPLVGYVVHALNAHRVDLGSQLRAFAIIEQKHRDLRTREGVAIDGRWFTRQVAGGHRRAGRRATAARAYWRGALKYRSPGNAVRALAVLVSERAMRLGRRTGDGVVEEPAWLVDYRADSSS